MKKLAQFVVFDHEAFFKDKMLQVIRTSEWLDFQTKAHMGSKVEALIAKDNTQYKQKEGENVSNAFEKLTLKIRKDVNPPTGAYVTLVNPVCTVYGDYRNQLSVTADDIRIIPKNN